jgi:hypothetical protein
MFRITVLLIAAILAGNNPSWSQKKLNLSAFTGSGISCFRGSGTVSNSVYHRNGLSFPHAIDTMANPYGRKAYTNWLAGLQADITLSSKWILLFSVQFENSGGKLTGDSVISPSASYKTSGTFKRYYNYVSFNPQIGRIIFQKGATFTLHTGIDYTSKLEMGYNFDFKDQNGQKNWIGGSGGEPEVNDMRITFGASLKRKKWSIDFNYKHGLVNYKKYGVGYVYSRLLHIRLQYTFLNKKV